MLFIKLCQLFLRILNGLPIVFYAGEAERYCGKPCIRQPPGFLACQILMGEHVYKEVKVVPRCVKLHKQYAKLIKVAELEGDATEQKRLQAELEAKRKESYQTPAAQRGRIS